MTELSNRVVVPLEELLASWYQERCDHPDRAGVLRERVLDLQYWQQRGGFVVKPFYDVRRDVYDYVVVVTR